MRSLGPKLLINFAHVGFAHVGRVTKANWATPSLNLGHRPPTKAALTEISAKHGNTLIRTLRKVYGQSFAAGYPDTEKLSEVLLKLNETSLSQLRRDHETGHLGHKITKASK